MFPLFSSCVMHRKTLHWVCIKRTMVWYIDSRFPVGVRAFAFMSSVSQVKVFSNQQKLLCVLSPLDLHVMFLQRQTSNTEKLDKYCTHEQPYLSEIPLTSVLCILQAIGERTTFLLTVIRNSMHNFPVKKNYHTVDISQKKTAKTEHFKLFKVTVCCRAIV